MYLKPNTYYQHRYGGVYFLTEDYLSESTVDNSKHVVYLHFFPYEKKIWHRPVSEFIDGRFRELTYNELESIVSNDREEFKAQIAANKAAAKGK